MDRNRRADRHTAPASASSAPAEPDVGTAPEMPDTQPPLPLRAQGYHPVMDVLEPEPEHKPRRKTVYTVIIIVLLAVFVFAAYQVVAYLVHSQQAKREEAMIQEMIAQSEAEAAQEDPASSPAPHAAATPALTAAQSTAPTPTIHQQAAAQAAPEPQVLIQFNKAIAINPDTVGQLQLGESINTYVVQRDNEYYLRHSFSGEYSFSGAIFLDVTCSINPQSRNLIIHGHNMKDGTAFGKLPRYADIHYLNQYPAILFSTLYETARYVPFAVVYFSVNPKSKEYLDVYSVNTMTDQDFMAFISAVKQRSVYRIPVYVANKDKILTLMTCASDEDDARFAIFAVQNDIL